MRTVWSIALAVLVLVGTVALGVGAASWMEASTPEDDACIGCGLVLLGSITVGVAGAVIVLVLAWAQRRPRPPHRAPPR